MKRNEQYTEWVATRPFMSALALVSVGAVLLVLLNLVTGQSDWGTVTMIVIVCTAVHVLLTRREYHARR
jgi:hypothetical protein